jgi:hypothetical protein
MELDEKKNNLIDHPKYEMTWVSDQRGTSKHLLVVLASAHLMMLSSLIYFEKQKEDFLGKKNED